jgi:hypothetical protein
MSFYVLVQKANPADNFGAIVGGARCTAADLDFARSVLFADKQPPGYAWIAEPEGYTGPLNAGAIFPAQPVTPPPPPAPIPKTPDQILAEANEIAEGRIQAIKNQYPPSVVHELWPQLAADVTGTGDLSALIGAGAADIDVAPETMTQEQIDAFKAKVIEKRIAFAYAAQKYRKVAQHITEKYESLAEVQKLEFNVSKEWKRILDAEA